MKMDEEQALNVAFQAAKERCRGEYLWSRELRTLSDQELDEDSSRTRGDIAVMARKARAPEAEPHLLRFAEAHLARVVDELRRRAEVRDLQRHRQVVRLGRWTLLAAILSAILGAPSCFDATIGVRERLFAPASVSTP